MAAHVHVAGAARFPARLLEMPRVRGWNFPVTRHPFVATASDIRMMAGNPDCRARRSWRNEIASGRRRKRRRLGGHESGDVFGTRISDDAASRIGSAGGERLRDTAGPGRRAHVDAPGFKRGDRENGEQRTSAGHAALVAARARGVPLARGSRSVEGAKGDFGRGRNSEGRVGDPTYCTRVRRMRVSAGANARLTRISRRVRLRSARGTPRAVRLRRRVRRDQVGRASKMT